VGNKEVGQMLGQYMPDLSKPWGHSQPRIDKVLILGQATYNKVGVFGYLCGGSPIFRLEEVETIVVSAIIGLGATRQARSHTKAAMQLGIAVEILAAIDRVAQDIAKWNETPLPEVLDIAQLRRELSRELDKIGVSLL
jgi:hypothetical protein